MSHEYIMSKGCAKKIVIDVEL